jgi:hypothetical protein
MAVVNPEQKKLKIEKFCYKVCQMEIFKEYD